jgi:hypothetical protein
MYYEDRLNGQGLARVVVAARDVTPAVAADIDALGRTLTERAGQAIADIDPRAVVRLTDPPAAGERTAMAAAVGVLLRERTA